MLANCYRRIYLLPITTRNIDEFRLSVAISKDDLPDDIWLYFDKITFDLSSRNYLVDVESLFSFKDQSLDKRFITGQKQDSRLVAFNRMIEASKGKIAKRGPLLVREVASRYELLDGNATGQLLMMAGWKKAPVTIIDEPPVNEL
jgi:hypothetical protein